MTENSFDEELSPQEMLELNKFLTHSSPTPMEQHNVHKFLHEVAESDDTTKTGYLKDEELGNSILPLRTTKELSLFCKEIANMDYFADYFQKEGEILTSTSLSRDGKLLELAVTARRQLEDVTKPKKENKGWFKKKNKGGGLDNG